MNLAQKLKQKVQVYNSTQNDTTYIALKKRVLKKLTLAAEDGKEVLFIKLTTDGERYWSEQLLNYLNNEKLHAITYSFSRNLMTIRVTWYNNED